MENNNLVIEVVNDIDFSSVLKSDIPILKDILKEIFSFEHPMPKLDTDIFYVNNHYNVSIKNFAKQIDLADFYQKFLGPNRPANLEYITCIKVTPAPEPVFLVQIKSIDYSESKHRSKSRYARSKRRK